MKRHSGCSQCCWKTFCITIVIRRICMGVMYSNVCWKICLRRNVQGLTSCPCVHSLISCLSFEFVGNWACRSQFLLAQRSMRFSLDLVCGVCRLATHFDKIDFDVSLVTTEWFLCLFAKSLPSEVCTHFSVGVGFLSSGRSSAWERPSRVPKSIIWAVISGTWLGSS